MASKRTSVIALSTSFSPIGDHFRRPPNVWPAVNTSEITDAMRRSRVVVMTCLSFCDSDSLRSKRAGYCKNGNPTVRSDLLSAQEPATKFIGYVADEFLRRVSR